MTDSPSSSSALDLCLVVPCFNEADRLDASAFLAFVEAREDLSLLFIDDGSEDETAAVLEDLTRKHPRIESVALPVNRGKGEAVRQGLLHALEKPVALVGYWDADLATPLSELDRFVQRFRENPQLELLLGSRVRLLGRDIRRKALRHYLGRVASTLAASILGLDVYDTQCGAKLLRKTDALRGILAEPFLTRWIFDVELIARWLDARRSRFDDVEMGIQELPLRAWHDAAGSRIRWVDTFLVPLDLLRILRVVRRSRRATADLNPDERLSRRKG